MVSVACADLVGEDVVCSCAGGQRIGRRLVVVEHVAPRAVLGDRERPVFAGNLARCTDGQEATRVAVAPDPNADDCNRIAVGVEVVLDKITER